MTSQRLRIVLGFDQSEEACVGGELIRSMRMGHGFQDAFALKPLNQPSVIVKFGVIKNCSDAAVGNWCFGAMAVGAPGPSIGLLVTARRSH